MPANRCHMLFKCSARQCSRAHSILLWKAGSLFAHNWSCCFVDLFVSKSSRSCCSVADMSSNFLLPLSLCFTKSFADVWRNYRHHGELLFCFVPTTNIIVSIPIPKVFLGIYSFIHCPTCCFVSPHLLCAVVPTPEPSVSIPSYEVVLSVDGSILCPPSYC